MTIGRHSRLLVHSVAGVAVDWMVRSHLLTGH